MQIYICKGPVRVKKTKPKPTNQTTPNQCPKYYETKKQNKNPLKIPLGLFYVGCLLLGMGAVLKCGLYAQ